MRKMILRILGGYVTYFLAIGLVFGGIALLGAGDAVTNDPVGRMIAQLVLALVASGMILVYAQRWGGVPIQQIGFGFTGRDLLVGLLAMVVTVVLAWLYMTLLGRSGSHAYTVLWPSLTLFLIGLVGEFGALHEEVESRGYFLTLLQQPYGAALALFGSALLFALGHIPFKGVNWMLIANFFGGIGFGYLYLKSGSIWVGLMAHAAHNLATDLFFTGSNNGVSVGIALFHFDDKLTLAQRLPYDAILMLLMIAVAYLGYGWGTRLFAPSPRLALRWHAGMASTTPAATDADPLILANR